MHLRGAPVRATRMAKQETSIAPPPGEIQRPRCACFNLRRATRAVTQIYDDAVRPLGIRATQFGLLMAVEMMEPVSVGDLARVIDMDRTTLTRNLKLLEKGGLVQIKPGKDRRVRECLVTPEGARLIQRGRPLWAGVQSRIVQEFGTDRYAHFLGELSDLVDAARR